MSWDPFQREVLAELGHVLYRLPGVAPAAAPMDDGMLARLARAAGLAADALQADIAALAPALRGDAAAKRALWPRLRALRRPLQ